MKNFYFGILLLAFACNNPSQTTLFTQLSSSETGINFTNQLDLKEDFDVFRYRNYYNGGGVAIGDINNDGLADVYLTSNTGKNKLYLNQGNFKFKDISQEAGVEGTKAWSTGVSMADVNGDGWLDIYVCNSGNVTGDNKENELFINQGISPPSGGTGGAVFKEQAKQYGLDDTGFSTHAAFLDYDLDGDLDCYLLNNSFRPIGSFGLENIRHIRDEKGGDKLFRNDNGKFVDVSEEAGIYGSVVGFGLGIAVSDVNADGYPDIYVSNDFFERDYLYINNQDGTFKESLTTYIRNTSEFSMGSDIGDINNDGYPEIFTTDMLPEDDYRLKMTQSFPTYDVVQARLKNDYYEQFMRNMLQLNNGDGTFSDVGLYTGVAATDWSWGALIADFDNNGNKEIYVTNGIYKDVTDQDFINFLADDERLQKINRGEKINFKELVDKMPSTKLPNYMFVKDANSLKFKNLAKEWGLAEPSFSNGAAYGDLDNDGDLDLIANNLNQPLFVYRNNSEKMSKNHFLKIKFKGNQKNVFGVGANVTLYKQGKQIFFEHYPTRGFQSSMDYTATLGTGDWAELDSLKVVWAGNFTQIISKPKTNQTLTLDIKNAQKRPFVKKQNPSLNAEIKLTPEFTHTENDFVDFDQDRLLYHMLSQQGPALATGDLNNDGLDDFYIGGAKDQSGAIYLQTANGFNEVNAEAFAEDKKFEDVDAKFFDADNDGDLDLYVVSGGVEYPAQSAGYQDRLYLNQGSKNQPKLVYVESALPEIGISGACVEVADFDDDKDLDLFVGGRVVPGKYGTTPNSILLENDGKGKFRDVTSEKASQLKNIGMVTDALWFDYDEDGALDLILVGEWMPITIFKNRGEGFQKVKNPKGFENTAGFWNTISLFDMNQDGKEDLILGNLGLNSRFKASAKEPFTLYINDFDQNGSLDHVFAHYNLGKEVPFALKQNLTAQMVSLKKKFLYFKDFAGKSTEEIFGKESLENSTVLQAQTFASMVAVNQGRGNFKMQELPEFAQFSTINTASAIDLDNDNKLELIIAGNFSGTKPEIGKYNASYGLVLKSNKNNFQTMLPRESGLSVTGDVRKTAVLKSSNGNQLVIFARNNDKPKFIRIKND
jgi:enediyne biosynthesis protein E4